VVDKDPPQIIASGSGNPCGFPRSSGGTGQACFGLKDIVKAKDGCGKVPTLTVVGCNATSNGANADCVTGSLPNGKPAVCVTYPPQGSGGVVIRTATVRVRAEDTSGNQSPVLAVPLTVYSSKPSPVPSGCKPK
jgi:hypothetical protein